MSTVARLQAPKEDGAVLSEPPLGEVPGLVERNRAVRRSVAFSLLGRDFPELCRQAREEAVAAARAYLQSAGEPLPDVPAGSLVLAGHQPELFHPGVWIKNFALNRIARAAGAAPLNLIVDNDAVKSVALAVPRVDVERMYHPADGTGAAASLHLIAFDHAAGEMPYEERVVADEAFFAGFPERVAANWPFRPLLGDFWEEVLRHAGRTPLLGERFTAARRTFERRWGCHNLELPVSRLCATDSYGWFFLHLLAELPRFHAIHNDAVHAYRRRYRLRSPNHPVPDLTAKEGWLEMPFWSWRHGQKRRSRLFARRDGRSILLRCGDEPWPTLPDPLTAPPDDLIETWRGLVRQGFKVRSRALTNTLFARLFVGDLFVHGIGGGRYDELTDELIRCFFGVEPPGYLVLSGTLLLPFPRLEVTPDDCLRLWRRVWDLRHNPQRHLAEVGVSDGTAQRLVREKQQWIARRWETRAQRLERFDHLKRLTAELRSYLGGREAEAHRRWEACREQLHTKCVLQRRDYAFCLYPEEMLREFCTRFL